jgi:hypothetical protein
MKKGHKKEYFDVMYIHILKNCHANRDPLLSSSKYQILYNMIRCYIFSAITGRKLKNDPLGLSLTIITEFLGPRKSNE